jgi:hypothetical protein
LPNVDLHRWYSQAPYLRQSPDGRQVASLRLAQASLVVFGLLATENLYVLGVEGFGVGEMQPAHGNALDQEPLERGGLRTCQLLGKRRAFPGNGTVAALVPGWIVEQGEDGVPLVGVAAQGTRGREGRDGLGHA